MISQLNVNRIEVELERWRSREERFSKLFSFDLSTNRSLLKEKLKFYENISARYGATQNLDERFALKVLRREQKQIEMQIYPNFLIRIFRRLVVRLLQKPLLIKKNIENVEKNSQALQHQLRRAGFDISSTKLDQLINTGKQDFTIPVSYYNNSKERIDHQIYLSKDQAGNYQFEGYQSSLYNDVNSELIKQQYFSMKSDFVITVSEATNLLAGRAIYKEGTWLQLNFNDKDAEGNFLMKQFLAGYGFDLDRLLNELPIKELSNGTEVHKLKEGLMQGDCKSVLFDKDGKEQLYFVEANPQYKSINIYDADSNKVSLAAALETKSIENVKVIKQVAPSNNEKPKKASRLHLN